MAEGVAFSALVEDIRETIATTKSAALPHEREVLEQALNHAVSTTALLTKASGVDSDRAWADATLYLDMLSGVVVGWIWLRQGIAAAARLESSAASGSHDFYRGKLQACRWYIRNEASLVAHQCALLNALEPTAFEMRDEWF